MRIHGSSAATLLLFLYVTTRSVATNGQLVKSRRATARKQSGLEEATSLTDKNDRGKRTAGFLVTHSPGKINNEILSLVDVQTKANAPSAYDQQVDQSEIVIGNADDLENIEHALSVAEYEPQRINRKKKRRIVGVSEDNPDSELSSSQNADLTVPDVYYEVPKTVQGKKIIVTPQYYPRQDHESHRSLDTDAKSTSRDIEYVYPVPTPVKVTRPRFPKNRPPLNPQISSAADEAKLENTPTPRVLPIHRSYSSLSAEARRPKHFVDQVATTTPSSGASYSTRATRRRKSRQRVTEKASSQQNASRSEDNNGDHATDATRVRNIEGRSKSRRLSAGAKYDVAPRPFARLQTAKGRQDSDSEKLRDESATLTRGSSSRSPHPNALKSSEGDSSGYPKVADSTRSPLSGLNRKLYERKDSRKSSTVQVGVNSPLPFAERPQPTEYQEIGVDRSLLPYKSHLASEGTGSSEDKSLKIKSAQIAYLNSLEAAPKVSSSTPLSLDSYQSINAPVVTLHSVGPVSTVAPYSSPSPYSSNLVLYPPVVSTLAPIQHFEVSTVLPWTSQVKTQPKQRHVGVDEEGEKNTGESESDQTTEEKVSDGVAEASSFEGEEGEGSKVKEGKYEIHESPDDGHGVEAEDRDRSSRDDRERGDYGGGGDEHGGQEHFDEKKYENSEGDVLGESSHESSRFEEHRQDLKESASGDGSGGKGSGAGDGKFEKGESAVRQEGHKHAEGEKGQKGYKSWHENEKANKGHHDKERHSNYYDEQDGKEKENKEEGGYHEDHEEGEKGEKKAEFDEKGEHQKGYSTKGQHFVHKKDEFEKRTEFFDEFHDEGDIEKDGDFYQEHEMKKGGHHKASHHDEGDHEEKYGKEAKHENGKHYLEEKGHKVKEGQDSRYEDESMHGKKKDQHGGKKWAYKKGDDGSAGNAKKSDH